MLGHYLQNGMTVKDLAAAFQDLPRRDAVLALEGLINKGFVHLVRKHGLTCIEKLPAAEFTVRHTLR
ncbi:hypothetical protein SAMN05428964_10939 [Thalassospira xiamenensis]|uniref:Uncharacterized protein n=1 Tax=Thalassospira xiamenensis TaxID=220697 RepID=A0A285U1J6_9PROT|nr:hypothetical protein SAMN05428964_10939 [Thalassospira xiamenensis]